MKQFSSTSTSALPNIQRRHAVRRVKRSPAVDRSFPAASSDAPGEWTAIVYPDSADLSKWVATPRFQSLEMCRRAAKESIAALPDPAKASYACGYQCGQDPGSPDLKACKEMKT